MNLFGRDCGCDERRAYMLANPVAFAVLAAVLVALAAAAWKAR